MLLSVVVAPVETVVVVVVRAAAAVETAVETVAVGERVERTVSPAFVFKE